MVRGRKPLSQEAKEASGSFEKHPERRNHAAPRVVYGIPTVPSTIEADPIAKAKWDHLCLQLHRAGILATIDSDLVESYCVTYSLYRKALASVQAEGATVTKGNGDVMRNPACIELSGCMARMAKLMTELGLTPSARSRIIAAPKDDGPDPFDELMDRMAN
jgi:P27 family predicted phage terminase small subunit